MLMIRQKSYSSCVFSWFAELFEEEYVTECRNIITTWRIESRPSWLYSIILPCRQERGDGSSKVFQSRISEYICICIVALFYFFVPKDTLRISVPILLDMASRKCISDVWEC